MTELLSPIGRLVQGSLYIPSTKNKKGEPLLNKDGGPRVQYWFSLAIRKDNPEFNAFWAQVTAAAAVEWPRGESLQAGFAWKLKDGDHPDFATREGWPGCWIVRPTNGFDFKVHNHDCSGIQEGVKCGDFVSVLVEVANNKSAETKGIFLNIRAVQFHAYGTPIVGTDYSDHFKKAGPQALPLGASATPLAQPGVGMPAPGAQPGLPAPGVQPGLPAPGVQPGLPTPGPAMAMPTLPAPTMALPMPGAPGVQPGLPIPGVGLPAPGMPMPQTSVAPAPNFAAPQYNMTPAAKGFSYDQYIEKGWTHDQIVAAGYIA